MSDRRIANRLSAVTERRVAIRHLIENYWRPDIALFVGAMALSGVILTVNTITLSNLRDEILRSVQANVESQAIVLAQESDRSLKVLDLALSSISEDIARLGVPPGRSLESHLAGREVHGLLREKSAGLSHVDAISLIDADGKLVNVSRLWPVPDVDVSDRDYFQALKPDTTLRVFIGRPVRNRTTGASMIYLARRLSAPDGAFMGLVLGGITLDHFEHFFQSIAQQEGSAVALVRRDGMLLARYPPTDQVGKVVPAMAAMSLPESARARRTESPLDGQVTILSTRALESYPVVVAASQTEHAALQSWNRFADHSTSMSLARIFVVLLMALAATRWWRKQHTLTQELREQNLRFDAALANMGEGLCMFDGNKRLVVCNDLYAKLYQLPPELLQTGTPHSAIIAHQVAHGILKGETDHSAVERKLADLDQLPSDATSSRIDELADGRLICVTRHPTEGHGWVATHQDISARLLAEKRLERTRAFLDTVIENIPMPVIVKEPNTLAFVLVNHAYEKFLGISRKDIIGKTIDQLLQPESAEQVLRCDTDALNSGKDIITAAFEMITPANGALVRQYHPARRAQRQRRAGAPHLGSGGRHRPSASRAEDPSFGPS
jgi:PAS domain S-box-containing protein